MSSTYTLYPSSVADKSPTRRDRMNEPRSLPSDDSEHHISPSTPVAGAHLSPLSPQLRLRSSSSSPALNTHTPAESSTLSVHYQSSEFSDAEDPFFGVDFGALDGDSPAFLEDNFLQLGSNEGLNNLAASQTTADVARHAPQGARYLPLSPDKTPSLHNSSPNGEGKGDRATFPGLRQDPIAIPTLDRIAAYPASSLEGKLSGYQFTPENSGSGRSSEDGLAPAAAIMPAQSPRLTVSMWGRDGAGVPYPLDTDQHHSTFGDISEDDASYEHVDHIVSAAPTVRDSAGRWVPDQATGNSGLDPDNRPATEGPTPNELAARRKLNERNQQVGNWVQVQRSATPPQPIPLSPAGEAVPEQPAPPPPDIDIDNLRQEEIDPNDETQNNVVSGQTYFTGKGGELTEQDVELMRQNRNWEAPPLPFEISRGHYQPPTSQAAIAKFEKMCRDNDSIVSRAATWGTRRRSLPIIDIEGITSGSFLKKLTISRGNAPRPNIFGGLRGLVRKPSATLNKRARADNDDSGSNGTDSSTERNQSQQNLAPPSRAMSWGKKNPPSINTAFVAMGSSMGAVGTAHARSGSISAAPISSPRSAGGFGLSVKKPLNRIRSKSDITKNQSSIADMWKKTGGPPVASLATSNTVDADDEDDDDDDIYEDSEMRTEANKIIDDITPNLAGFQQHILKLNPMLVGTNTYLVDRIAHQQIVRYKSLLNARVKHLQCTAVNNCSCGTLCIALGGSANILDSRGDPRALDPMSARYDGSDGDVTPLEGPGVISLESFPQDIPMPPASILPAEFECQLCFQAKKFQKPSDWTKHVHEDVQPFTCTWDRCRDPKIFKRKADWVRHENEGHRHLEWWDCDVEDCRHVCYRRDNFLQHLVREHKYPEPKVKTKAAIKRAGGLDPTWQKVEQCHKETPDMPHDEPCRFCGKTFPTWKKLTVHLAKHMEQISLPVLKLVARKELDADTIISPVQDPPPRSFPAPFPVKSESQQYDPSPIMAHPQMTRSPGGHLGYPTTPHQMGQGYNMYPIVPTDFQPTLYSPNFNGMPPNMGQAPLSVQTSHGQFASLNIQAYSDLPVTSGGTYMVSPNQYTSAPDVEQFSALSVNALGLQNPNAGVYGGMNGGMMEHPNSAGTEQQHYTPQGSEHQHYTPQGSVSPYAHSPLQGPGAFYPQ